MILNILATRLIIIVVITTGVNMEIIAKLILISIFSFIVSY